MTRAQKTNINIIASCKAKLRTQSLYFEKLPLIFVIKKIGAFRKTACLLACLKIQYQKDYFGFSIEILNTMFDHCDQSFFGTCL